LLVVVAEDQRVQQQEYSHPTITASNAYTAVFKYGLCMTTVMIHSEFLSLFQQPPDATMFLPLTKYQIIIIICCCCCCYHPQQIVLLHSLATDFTFSYSLSMTISSNMDDDDNNK
jgi:hypothetical protein